MRSARAARCLENTDVNGDPYAPSKVPLPFVPDSATRGERIAVSLILWTNLLSSCLLLLFVSAAGVWLALDTKEVSISMRTVILAAMIAAALSLWGSAALSMRRRYSILLLLPMLVGLGCLLAAAPDMIKLGWFCLHLWFVCYCIILWRRGRLS